MIAVMGIAGPVILSGLGGNDITPAVLVLTAYLTICLHYFYPLHHMNLLIGVGDDCGGHSNYEIMKMSFPLFITVFILILGIALPWWKLLGLF